MTALTIGYSKIYGVITGIGISMRWSDRRLRLIKIGKIYGAQLVEAGVILYVRVMSNPQYVVASYTAIY